MTKLAKAVYRPVGMLGSVAAGAIAGAIVKQVWKRISGEDDAPDALQSEYPFREILLAAAIQGLVFALVQAVINRGGAKAFERVTGEWPGS